MPVSRPCGHEMRQGLNDRPRDLVSGSHEWCPLPLPGVAQDSRGEVLSTEVCGPHPWIAFGFGVQGVLLVQPGRVLGARAR